MSAPANETNDDTGRAAKAAAILGGLFALAALSLYGTRAACSVLVGAGIGIANLLTMRAIIRALVQAPAEESKPEDSSEQSAPPPPDHKGAGRSGGVAWGLFAAFKILILFGGVWILLTRKLVDPMPLVIGYGVLPLGIAAAALWSSLETRR